MSDENKQDAAESIPASAGSVLCVWGWVQTDWDGTEFVIPCRDHCEATRRASYGWKAVQFFPQPALTDAEREAVEWAARMIDDVNRGDPVRAETLRTLLTRLA